MQQVTPSPHLIKDTLTFHLNTQLTTGLVLNGDYKSKIQFDLRNYVNLDDDDIEYCTVGLPNCVMTNSNYIVNEYNSQMSVGIDGAHRNWNIPYGNYTRASWVAYQQAKLDLAYYPASYFVVSYDNVTNKFTITVTPAFRLAYPTSSWGFGKSYDPAFTTCDYIWGFRSYFFTPLDSYTMDRVYNFLPIPRFVFHCNILSSGITMTNGGVGSCDVLAVIPNSSRLNSQIIYENNTKTYLVKSNATISNIVISITDDDNRLINFNGISAYFDIQFNIFRRSIMRPLRFKELVQKAGETAGQYENIIVGE